MESVHYAVHYKCCFLRVFSQKQTSQSLVMGQLHWGIAIRELFRYFCVRSLLYNPPSHLEMEFCLVNCKVEVSHFASSSHSGRQLGLDSARHNYCLQHLPSLGHDLQTALLYSYSCGLPQQMLPTLGLQPESRLSTVPASGKQAGKTGPKKHCWIVEALLGSVLQVDRDRWRESELLKVVRVMPLAVPSLEAKPSLGQLLCDVINWTVSSLISLLLPHRGCRWLAPRCCSCTCAGFDPTVHLGDLLLSFSWSVYRDTEEKSNKKHPPNKTEADSSYNRCSVLN